MHARILGCMGVVFGVVVMGGCGRSIAPGPGESPVDGPAFSRQLSLAVFDTAWSRIHRSHYDSTFNGVDWVAVRAELRPRAERAADEEALRRVIGEMVGRLGESHFGLIPREVADAVDPDALRAEAGVDHPGDTGMEVRLTGDQVVVTRIEAGGPADRAGIRPGWLVEAIDETDLHQIVAAVRALDAPERRTALTRFLYSANGMLTGLAGSHVELRLRDGVGAVRVLSIERRQSPGQPVRIGNLPTFLAFLESRRVEATHGCAGVVRFNVWMIPLVREFDRAIDTMRDCTGVVVDLRGNPGGVAGMVSGIAGHFLAEPVALGVMRSRAGELRFVANPRRVDSSGQAVSPYAGAVAVLVDAMSASTSEFFAGGMQAIGRARVFGETSAGQALPAVVSRLPNDDVLMYVIADYADPHGRRFEGAGVVPNVRVGARREDLLAGRDPVLEAALAWIAAGSASGR